LLLRIKDKKYIQLKKDVEVSLEVSTKNYY